MRRSLRYWPDDVRILEADDAFFAVAYKGTAIVGETASCATYGQAVAAAVKRWPSWVKQNDRAGAVA